MRTPLLATLFASTALNLSACVTGSVTVPNTKACTLAGAWEAGAMCTETVTGLESDLTQDEYLDFLEPQDARPDPKNPGLTLPERSGAVCQSSSDWNAQKTALEQACRILGTHCPYEMKQSIANMTNQLVRLKGIHKK